MDAGPSCNHNNLNSQLNAVKLTHIALRKGKPAFVVTQQTGAVYQPFGL